MFFRLADPAGDLAGWRAVGLLYDPGHDYLDVLLGSVQAALGECEPRVAGSLFYQGYASRLLSPPLACLATSGCIPEMPAGQLRWRRPDDQMIELGLTAGGGWAGSWPALIEHLVETWFEEHLQPLADALRLRVRISADLLTDNAASALVSGLRLLAGRLGPDGRSPAGDALAAHDLAAHDLAAHALAQPRLRDSGRWRGEVFVRRSCCLYYRVEGGGMCGDCPLADAG